MAGRGASYNQIWCRYLYALRNPRWPPSAILDLLGETWAHPRSCIKNFVTIGWVVFKLQLIFCCSGLKVLFAPQKFQFFWGRGWPQNLGWHHLDSQKAHPCMKRRVLSLHWSRSDARCDLCASRRNKKKQRNVTVANWPRHPRGRIEIKFCVWVSGDISKFQVSSKSVKRFRNCRECRSG